ncbi:MAG: limonene-1,2-epoxide hydrolase family protein [Gammaproteobacteria bacterium]
MDRRSFVQGAVGAPLALGAGAVSAAAGKPEASAFDQYASFLELIRAWKRRDLDGVLAKLADDIVWYARVGAAPVVGKAAVRKALESIGSKRKQENWRICHHAVSSERLFVEGVDDYIDDQGRRVAVPYAGVTEYRDRLIIGWRDYFDIATLERQKAGGPIPDVIEPLISRSGEP